MPDFRLHAPEQAAPGVVDVHRRQVGQRAAAPVLVLDEARPAGAGGRRARGGAAALQLGLLVGADDVVARVQPLALPATLIEIQDTAGLGSEVGVAREHPCLPGPRPDRILRQPAPDRRSRHRAHHAALDGRGGQLSRRPLPQRLARLRGKLARDRLDLGDLRGGKTTGAARASASHQVQPGPPRRIFVATCPASCQCIPAGGQSRRSSARRRPATRCWPAAPRDADACTAPHADAAPAPPPR